MDLALTFSPNVEQTCPNTVVFSITSLRRLLGSPHQIASEICRQGYERKLQANLAVAANPDSAVLLARNIGGVTLVTPGEERLKTALLPLDVLFRHHVSVDPKLLITFRNWGLKACGDLADLPEAGLAARMGQTGVYLQKLSRGTLQRPLKLWLPETNYKKEVELEYPVELLEPLLFLLSRILNDICAQLRSQSKAARELEVCFRLENKAAHQCRLEFPVALNESRTILKLLQLHLERHGPPAPVVAFTVSVKPDEPRRLQGSLFLPPTPEADKLQVTLARISGLVGKHNIGTPMLLNTHRPDAFEIVTPDVAPPEKVHSKGEEKNGTSQATLRLAMRLFRPALEARVRIVNLAPRKIVAPGVEGSVIQSAGPWKISGEWWTTTPWVREEWDVALDDGALYRIFCEPPTGNWYIYAIYD